MSGGFDQQYYQMRSSNPPSPPISSHNSHNTSNTLTHSQNNNNNNSTPKQQSNNTSGYNSPFETITQFFRGGNRGDNNNNNNTNSGSGTLNTPNQPSPTNSPIPSSNNSQNNNNNNIINNINMQSPKGSTNYNSLIQPNSQNSGWLSKRVNADCVVLSEFSEQTGPVALNVIPEQLPHFDGFNISNYVVKIMSVDFQNKTNDLRTYIKDSQMFFTFSAQVESQELYAYVHHFSLFDIYARGYVRPLVISYITKDPHKVIKFFDKFLTQFTRVINFLKVKNHMLFEMEFRHRKRDLEHTLQHYKSMVDISDKDREHHIHLIMDAISELKGIEALFEDERQKNLNLYQQQHHHHHHHHHHHNNNNNNNNNNNSNTTTTSESNKKSKGVVDYLQGNNIVYYNDTIVLNNEPKIMDQLNKTAHLDKALRNVSELCPDVFDKFLRKLEKCYNYFSKPAIQMEFDVLDNQCLSPNSTLLSIGQTSILNFNFNQIPEKKQHYIKSQLKEISKIKSTKKQQQQQGPNSMSYSSESSSSYVSVYSSNSMNEQFDLLSFSPNDNLHYNSTSSLPSGPVPLSPSPIDSSNLNQALTSILANVGGFSEGAMNLNQSTSLMSQQQHQLQQLQHKKNSEFKFESFSNYLWGVSKPNYGLGLLKISKTYSWLKHAIFSILKGRPLIIVGAADKQQQIISMVYALSIFVVGQSKANKEHFNPWKTSQLLLSDLSTLKLIGMPKPKPPQPFKIPTNVNAYISKVDLDTEEYTGPLYSTQYGIIDEILAIKRHWNENETLYTSHIQCVLFEMALKSFLYYHMCCAHPHSLYKLSHPYLSPTSPLYGRSTSNNSTTQPNETKGTNSGTSILSLSTSNLPKPEDLIPSPSQSNNTINNNNNSNSLSPIPPQPNAPPVHKSISAFARKKPSMVSITSRSLSESHIEGIVTIGSSQHGQPSSQHPQQSSTVPTTPSNSHNNSSLSTNATISPSYSSNNVPLITTSHQQQQQTAHPGGKLSSPSQSPHHTLHGSYGVPNFKAMADPKLLFRRWEINPQDQIIIEYLSEVIKEQQWYDYYLSKGHEMTPIVKLDFNPISTLKNKK